MDFKNLTPEQQEKARACQTPEDMLALAREEGYELSDEELQSVAGGRSWGEHCEDYGHCGVPYWRA